MAAIEKLIQKCRTATDDQLIFSALAMDEGLTEEARMVCAAAIEVLVERHPEVNAALDRWEMDMETELTMAQVVALELAA